jgi:hypothetical protein
MSVPYLKAVVQFYAGYGEMCKETNFVTYITKNGAVLTLSRSCQIGSLVRLSLPMPREFRVYDVDEELYQIIGLVQYCHASTDSDQPGFRLGLGFIGKDLPQSYKDDPTQSYVISDVGPDGLWQIVEAVSQFKPRAAERFSIPLNVTISFSNKLSRAVEKQTTVTRNISSTGASIICWLGADVGDRVKFACEEHGFYAFALVCGRKEHPNGPPTLHLEFIDARFPAEQLSPK